KGVGRGDAVEGLVADGKLTPAASARAFYQAVWAVAPQKQPTVTVRVGGRDVALDVSQGADERKPLVSLFVTAGGGAAAREGGGAGARWARTSVGARGRRSGSAGT